VLSTLRYAAVDGSTLCVQAHEGFCFGDASADRFNHTGDIVVGELRVERQ
jgi:hypothetical protein